MKVSKKIFNLILKKTSLMHTSGYPDVYCTKTSFRMSSSVLSVNRLSKHVYLDIYLKTTGNLLLARVS